MAEKGGGKVKITSLSFKLLALRSTPPHLGAGKKG
jgi:hypothetical protein